MGAAGGWVGRWVDGVEEKKERSGREEKKGIQSSSEVGALRRGEERDSDRPQLDPAWEGRKGGVEAGKERLG